MAAKDKDPAAAEVTQDAPAVGTASPESVKGAEMAGVPRDSKVAGGRADGPILTADPPKEADRTSMPVPNDAKPEDPPVRTTRTDVPIVAAIASGAGEHQPPDLDEYWPDGRPKDQ